MDRSTNRTTWVAPDLHALVAFNHAPAVLCPLISVLEAKALSRPKVEPSGTTTLAPALDVARRMLTGLPRGTIKRIAVISDGEPQDPEASLDEAVLACRNAWISVDTVSINDGASTGDQLLKRIASMTVGGVHFDAKTVSALRQALGRTSSGRYRRRAATVVLLDRSSSMSEMFGRETRMEAAIDAVLNFVATKRFRFGGVRHDFATN